MSNSVGRSWLLLVIIAGVLLDACGSPVAKPRCLPEIGMTTEDLVSCGCRLMDSGNLGSASVVRSESSPMVQTIIVVNYVCPMGRQGLATVSVVNGVAGEVFY
ncbi:hypothetical protein CCR96_10440 [Halochromatium roseum]|nr:hypothetical protein [Halochromatium roseum]